MSLFSRVKKALEADNTITVPKSKVETAAGFTPEYMKYLGLSKGDLRKLESKGLALRGYTKNFWNTGETLPNGKEVEKGQQYRGKGHRVKWILVADDQGGNSAVEAVQEMSDAGSQNKSGGPQEG